MADEKSTNPVWRITRWLLPVYTDEVGGQRVLVYTSFPKAFYFYLVWLPGFLVLTLNHFGVMSDTSVVWSMFGFCVLAYLIIAEDTGPMGFAVLAATGTASWVLFANGAFDFLGAQNLKTALEKMTLTLDPATLMVLNTLLLLVGKYFFWTESPDTLATDQ